MLTLQSLKQMRPMVCTPCMGGNTTSIYTASIFSFVNAFTNHGVPLKLEFLSESLITRARARLMARFLASDCTHLFWWDADVEAKPEAVARLLLSDFDVVGGIYPLKQYNWPDKIPKDMTKAEFEALYTAYPVNPIDGKMVSDQSGFAEVAEIPNGFMCIKRAVLIKMIAAYPELQFIPENDWDQENANLRYMLFDTSLEDKRLRSEDYAFCKRWRDLGGKVYADTASKLNHIGPYVFHGDFLASLRAQSTL